MDATRQRQVSAYVLRAYEQLYTYTVSHNAAYAKAMELCQAMRAAGFDVPEPPKPPTWRRLDDGTIVMEAQP